MSKESKGFKIGRDNESGRLIPRKEAEKRPHSTSIEVMPKKGHGDSGRYDKKRP